MDCAPGAGASSTKAWPDLPPLADWKASKTVLHMTCQMIGKVRMALHPKLNHWWHVTLYPSARGLTTQAIPLGAGRSLEIALDLVDHRLELRLSDGRHRGVALEGLSIADIHRALFAWLEAFDIAARIHGVPYDNPVTTPFAEDDAHRWSDRKAIHRYWLALTRIAAVFETFRGRFAGKQTPVQLYWHSFDIVTTRFSGRRAPLTEGRRSDIEAYSHEVVSCGFWPGDDTVKTAMFYGYAYPDPGGLETRALAPDAASWSAQNGSAMALLPYASVAGASAPEEALLSFLQSVYDASADAAGWPAEDLEHDYREG